MNFDPTAEDGPPGVGTVTGTFTIDTSIPIQDSRIAGQTGYQPTDVVAVDLVEKTNVPGLYNIGGAFGTPGPFNVFTFNQLVPDSFIFFGSLVSFPTSTATIGQTPAKFNDEPYMTLFFDTNCCNFDGLPEGPMIMFDFPYPQGGSVLPGNFDSTTSQYQYLYGTVTPVTGGVPETSTWAMMLLGFAGLGFAGYRKATHGRVALAQA